MLVLLEARTAALSELWIERSVAIFLIYTPKGTKQKWGRNFLHSDACYVWL